MRFLTLSDDEAREMLAEARNPLWKEAPALEPENSIEANLELLAATLKVLAPILDATPDERPIPIVKSFKL